jgi:hypothetical protein
MSTILAILTAGRKEYLDITIQSLEKHLKGNISKKIIFDNSDGPEIKYNGYVTVKVPGFDLPYGTIRHANANKYMFSYLTNLNPKNIVFFEEDWDLQQDVDVDYLDNIFKDEYSQILLRRDSLPDKLVPDGELFHRISDIWFFTLNPSIFRVDIATLGSKSYPLVWDHEEVFGKMLKDKKSMVYGEGMLVKHIGEYSIEKPIRWDDDYITHAL